MPVELRPVVKEVLADLETPVTAFLKITAGSNAPSFLLESVEGGETVGRYSFIGTAPLETIVTHGERDPLVEIERRLAQYRLVGAPDGSQDSRLLAGAVGYLSYDAVRHFERVPRTKTDALRLPEAIFMIPGVLVIFDHVKHRVRLVTYARGTGLAAVRGAEDRLRELTETLAAPLPIVRRVAATGPRRGGTDVFDGVQSNLSHESYLAAARRAKEYIAAGDIFQVVLSQRFSRSVTASPVDLYRAQRATNPSPYMFLLHYPQVPGAGDLALVGSSPEVMVRLEGSRITLRPIAGTRPRGATREEDARLERELLADAKERAEHLMLVDLGRNDVGRVAKIGTVKVDDFQSIERYSHVLHLVSNVTAELAHGKTAFDLLRATFPAGTVSGAPKIRAMEIIDELEPDLRGPYAGAVGYFDLSGNSDTAITLRTILVNRGRAYVQAGAGIVADSDPEREWEECRAKARAGLAAIRWAEEGLA